MRTNKFAVILFTVGILTSKVLGCTLVEGANPNTLEERQNEVFIILTVSFLFAIATTFLYFKKKQEGTIAVIVSFLVVGYTFLKSNVYIGDCGSSAFYNTKISVLITFVCFSFQFITWLLFRKKSYAGLI